MKHLTLTLILLLSLNAQETLPEIPTLSLDTNPTQNATQSLENTTPQAQTNPQTNSQEPNGITANLLQTSQNNTEENKERDPFTPMITPKDSGQITNAPQLNLFTKVELSLPSTARKIKRISLEYQNLNGSISTLQKDLDGDIDWHFPLILSQEVQPTTPTIPKEESFTLESFFNFDLTKNSITLQTHLTLLRDFTLASPTRLILDFEAPAKNPLKANFTPKIPTFPKVSLNTHLDFYRITLNLDGQYKYNLTKDEKLGKYIIEFY